MICTRAPLDILAQNAERNQRDRHARPTDERTEDAEMHATTRVKIDKQEGEHTDRNAAKCDKIEWYIKWHETFKFNMLAVYLYVRLGHCLDRHKKHRKQSYLRITLLIHTSQQIHILNLYYSQRAFGTYLGQVFG